MGMLVKVDGSAFDIEAIIAVHGTQVYFRDGRTMVVSRRAAAAILAAIPEWGGSIRAIRPPAPPAPPPPRPPIPHATVGDVPFPPSTTGNGC